MSATNFNTRNDTYRKLMGNGLTYSVPRFQRDYSWTAEEWEELWLDILGTVAPEGEPAHYMGYLVLQSSNEKQFEIIDGQQRLTTLSIIVLAALKNLERLIREGHDVDATKQRFDGLRQTYVGYLDPVTLVPRSKLSLNRNNDHYYQTYLVPLVATLPQRGFKATEHSLRKAFEWFEKRIRDHVSKSADAGLSIAQLIDTMSDRLFFTVITVTDELNAYKVFETLNARGVRLSSTDLLKNYLFSVLHREGQHEHELRALDDRWEGIVGRLGAESFADFLRVHWLSRRNFVRQSDLFKTIRGSIRSRADVFTLVSQMEEDVDTYLALTNPDQQGFTGRALDYSKTLKMFSVRQPLALLLAAHRRFDAQAFESLLRAIVVISLRYNIISSLPPSNQEEVYHTQCTAIADGTASTIATVLAGLRSVYPSDEAFRAAFADISTSQSRNRRIVRYILTEIEKQVSGVDLDSDAPKLTVEHICPSQPDAGWPEFTDEEVEVLNDRLGNMTLLDVGPNKDLGNVECTAKRAVYVQSQYAMTREVASSYSDWTPEAVRNRQRALSKIASSIWRIDQLS